MASMFTALPKSIRLLDAGAGVGSLTAAFVLEACTRAPKPVCIDVTAFEVDPLLATRLQTILSDCAEQCQGAGVGFTSRVVQEDYIEDAAAPLFSGYAARTQYDCAILNPPYAKINSNSRTRGALRSLGIETSNLYSAFVAIALDQLKEGGQLVAITPRSFCNGPYFESFRHWMLQRAALIRTHVYLSRRKAFRDDDVLQENVILHLVKGSAQPESVIVSSSHGPGNEHMVERQMPFAEVVLPSDPHRFIRLAPSQEDRSLAERVRALPCNLSQLGLGVSTGRVVDFRAREFLREEPGINTVPLVYPCHFDRGFVAWPRIECRKPNALVLRAETAALTVPRGTYVLTKRFSSKEERRRLVASIFDPDRVEAEFIGFENHVNYFHCGGQGMHPGLARGLSLFLNSTAVDQFFRQFSGHTQVNATDLRNLHYPSTAQLEAIGRYLDRVLPAQEEIDRVVEGFLWP